MRIECDVRNSIEMEMNLILAELVTTLFGVVMVVLHSRMNILTCLC